MALYAKAFDAEPGMVMDGPEGMIMHAEMTFGDHSLMMSGEFPGMSEAPSGRSPVNFMMYVDDVDAAFAKAVDAGMTSEQEPENQFWGDRTAAVADGMGYTWTLAKTFEEVSPEEMGKRAATYAEQMGG